MTAADVIRSLVERGEVDEARRQIGEIISWKRVLALPENALTAVGKRAMAMQHGARGAKGPQQ
jgi:hypothetical protein